MGLEQNPAETFDHFGRITSCKYLAYIRTCWNRLSAKIPIEQAAYEADRSTTEKVSAIKMLSEKAIISNNYNIYLLLLNVSKAFDTVGRGKLLKDLEEILEPD